MNDDSMIDEDEHIGSPRTEILEHIKSYPGIHFRVLMKDFSLAEGTLRHHLRVLIKTRKIKSFLVQGQRRYYPIGYSEPQVKSELRIDRVRLEGKEKLVMDFVTSHPRSNQQTIAKALCFGRFRLRLILNKMVDKGCIRALRIGRDLRFIPSTKEEIRREVIISLATDLISGEIDEKTYFKAKKKLDRDLFGK